MKLACFLLLASRSASRAHGHLSCLRHAWQAPVSLSSVALFLEAPAVPFWL